MLQANNRNDLSDRAWCIHWTPPERKISDFKLIVANIPAVCELDTATIHDPFLFFNKDLRTFVNKHMATLANEQREVALYWIDMYLLNV